MVLQQMLVKIFQWQAKSSSILWSSLYTQNREQKDLNSLFLVYEPGYVDIVEWLSQEVATKVNFQI